MGFRQRAFKINRGVIDVAGIRSRESVGGHAAKFYHAFAYAHNPHQTAAAKIAVRRTELERIEGGSFDPSWSASVASMRINRSHAPTMRARPPTGTEVCAFSTISGNTRSLSFCAPSSAICDSR